MIRSLKGRGAVSSPPPRFDRQHGIAIDDGWSAEPPPDSIATLVQPEPARTIISRNDSPDIGFSQSINPYRGCEHGCVYCLAGDTTITMADGSAKPLASLERGDAILGTVRHGHYRRYATTRVLAHWRTVKPAWRVTLADGTQLIASADHRFLTERGWKFVAASGSSRPRLTVNNSLLGFGRLPQIDKCETVSAKRGYLTGVIRGDGHLKVYSYRREGRASGDQHRFRLALIDSEPLVRTASWLGEFGVPTTHFAFSAELPGRRAMSAIRCSANASVASITCLVKWPERADRDWQRGFIGGIFDAEGSFSQGILRIGNTDSRIISELIEALGAFGFDTALESVSRGDHKPMRYVRIRGGLTQSLRFFRLFDPCIARKRSIAGAAVKSRADLRVVAIEPLPGARELFDITTGTGDFIANGVVSHNCYARPSHAYMGLSPGLDFETKLFFKAGAAERLAEELSKPRYVPRSIMLGANTDPYQPVEKRLRVTRSILEVLQKYQHPVSIVTKGALIVRDLDLLGALAQRRLAGVMVSLTTLDDDLKRRLEPRAASPAARLAMIRRLHAAGVPVGTLIAPVIPGLTDHELERLLEAAAEAGARCAGYAVLRLPHELGGLFRDWLATHYPERARHVMSRVHSIRGGRDNDPQFGSRMRGSGVDAALLRKRFELATRRLGLDARFGFELDTSLFRPVPADDPQLSLGW